MQCVLDGGPLKRSSDYDFKSDMFRSIYADRYIYKCMKCGLRQVDLAAVDGQLLSEYYRRHYRSVAQINVTSDRRRAIMKARGSALAGEITLAAPQRAFELGSGYGYNLMALKARLPGIQLFTDELDETVPRIPDVHVATLQDGPYDVIILSHVLSTSQTLAGCCAKRMPPWPRAVFWCSKSQMTSKASTLR